jgi:hypothetical protein
MIHNQLYLLDFTGCSKGMYKRTEVKVPIMSARNARIISFTDKQVLTTEPDLEAFATLASTTELPNFVTIRVDDVHAGRISIDAMKNLKHYVLIDGTWILAALIKKVHVDCFELSYGGGERIWANTFGMGEPL